MSYIKEDAAEANKKYLTNTQRKEICYNCPHSIVLLHPNLKIAFYECNLFNRQSICIRQSPVRCKFKPIIEEYMKSGIYDPRTRKTKTIYSGWKKYKTRIFHTRIRQIIRGLIDSFKINDFYPLTKALRGEHYELEKKVTEDSKQ